MLTDFRFVQDTSIQQSERSSWLEVQLLKKRTIRPLGEILYGRMRGVKGKGVPADPVKGEGKPRLTRAT